MGEWSVRWRAVRPLSCVHGLVGLERATWIEVGKTQDERALSQDERLQYTEMANRQMVEFDTRLLWFSGGGLVAVLAFAGTLKSRPPSTAIFAVALGALLLLTSSGLTLYSFQRSASDIARFLDKPLASFREQQMRDMKRLNLWSLAFTLGGLVCLGAFAVLVMASK